MVAAVPTKDEFARVLRRMLCIEEASGSSWFAVKVSDLDLEVGGFPESDYRLPLCRDVMVEEMWSDDEVLSASQTGEEISLCINYRLPRRELR